MTRVSKIGPSIRSKRSDASLSSDHHEEAATPLHRQLSAARPVLPVSGHGVFPDL